MMIRCMGCMKEYGGAGVCPHCGYVRGTPPREAYHLASESILAGRYIVGRVLGFGGFGVTYIGWDAQLERVVAIKEFLPTAFATRMPGGTALTVYEGGATEQFGFGLHRFVEEAQRLAQFSGIRGITDIYDTLSGNNTAYIVMEFLMGRDVKEILATDGPLPYEKARDIVLRVCEALSPVHARGIIHRDISPDNIYLTDDGRVKLLDFGAARYESGVNSKSLSVILKSGYAPEEQYRSKGDQGPWTDVYALAATFYKMLTGVTPPDSMERAVRDEIQEPSKLGALMPKSAENALMNALNLRKSERTQSVDELKRALQAGDVERVKVKPRRLKSGGVPVPAIVAMVLAGVLLVAYLALGTAGVVDLGPLAPAPDNFKAAEGRVMVPNLAGMSEDDARRTLEDAGLLMEKLTGAAIENPDGTVLAQLPAAGREVQEGESVQVTVCEGSLESHLAGGDLPIWRAEQLVSSIPADNWGNQSYWTDVYYEFSDDVPEGFVTRYEIVDTNRVVLWASAGRNNATETQGSLRGVYLTNEYPPSNTSHPHYVQIGYAIAMRPDMPSDDEDYNDRGIIAFHYSADGGSTWNPIVSFNDRPLLGDGNSRSGSSDEAGVPGNLTWITRDIDSALFLHMPHLAGKTLQLRADYHERLVDDDGNTYWTDEVGRRLQSVVLPQTLTFEYEDPAMPTVTGSEIVSWAEIIAMTENGEIPEHNSIAYQYKHNIAPDPDDPDDRGSEEYYTPLRLFGDFQQGERYRLTTYKYNSTDGYDRYDSYSIVECLKEGELIFLDYTGSRYNIGSGENSSYMLFISADYGGARCVSDESGNVTAYVRWPTQAPVVYSRVRTDWNGSAPLHQLVDAAPPPEGYDYYARQEQAAKYGIAEVEADEEMDMNRQKEEELAREAAQG